MLVQGRVAVLNGELTLREKPIARRFQAGITTPVKRTPDYLGASGFDRSLLSRA